MAFTDQGEFEATETLSGHRALCCDKHQLHDKMTVSIQTILLLNIVVLTRKNTKMALLFWVWLSSARLLGNNLCLANHKGRIMQKGELNLPNIFNLLGDRHVKLCNYTN